MTKAISMDVLLSPPWWIALAYRPFLFLNWSSTAEEFSLEPRLLR